MNLEEIALALGGKKSGPGWTARCPAHDDKTPSLSLNFENNRILVKCHTGCSQDAVLTALRARGLTFGDSDRYRTVKQYIYTSDGILERLRVSRQENSFGKKKFLQEHLDGSSWVYGKGKGPIAPLNYADWKESQYVFLVEGEKCVEAMKAVGLPATTTPGGASSWDESFARFFAGKDVCILPDNDGPGRQYAEQAFADLVQTTRNAFIVQLPSLKDGEDVADWLEKYGDAIALRKAVKELKPKGPLESVGFSCAVDRFSQIEKIQDRNHASLLKFGVSFLDEACGGLTGDDLAIFTGKSGNGKTQSAMNIARAAIANGKRVCFFALEGFVSEIETRMLYSVAIGSYIDEGARSGYVEWKDWVLGVPQARQALEPHIARAKRVLEKDFKRFFSFYRDKARRFDVKDFEQKFAVIAPECDLIILDHLNYFDSHEDRKSENQVTSEIIKRMRDQVLEHQKPVILVTHIRKSDYHDKRLMPDMYDIHGSSDVFKIATKVVIFGKAKDVVSTDRKNRSTYVRIPKDRIAGDVDQYTALMNYSTVRGGYDQEYQLGRLIKGDSEFKPLEGTEYPYWFGKGRKK